MITWLGTYTAATPGVDLGDNATCSLLHCSLFHCFDALPRLESALDGQSHITEDNHLEGLVSRNP